MRTPDGLNAKNDPRVGGMSRSLLRQIWLCTLTTNQNLKVMERQALKVHHNSAEEVDGSEEEDVPPSTKTSVLDRLQLSTSKRPPCWVIFLRFKEECTRSSKRIINSNDLSIRLFKYHKQNK